MYYIEQKPQSQKWRKRSAWYFIQYLFEEIDLKEGIRWPAVLILMNLPQSTVFTTQRSNEKSLVQTRKASRKMNLSFKKGQLKQFTFSIWLLFFFLSRHISFKLLSLAERWFDEKTVSGSNQNHSMINKLRFIFFFNVFESKHTGINHYPSTWKSANQFKPSSSRLQL